MTAATFVCPPEHGHGAKTTCYRNHGCRCFACRVAHSRYQEHRTKQIAYGRWQNGRVDAEPVREHLRYLSDFGIGYSRVARLTGTARSTLAKILRGHRGGQGPRAGEPVRHVDQRIATAVLAIRPDIAVLAPGALVPSRGAQRRIQALVASGWSIAKIAALLGWTAPNLHKILERDHVEARTHRNLDALYEQLATVHPPRGTRWELAARSRALNHAAAHGWVPPLAWDDIDQDPHPPVPDEDDSDLVDEHAVHLASTGVVLELTGADRVEAVRTLTAAGESAETIAGRLGITARTVTRIRTRLRDRGAA